MSSGAIAIVGLACRFPGTSDPESFWRNLAEGAESLTSFSPEETERHLNQVPAELASPAFIRVRPILVGAGLFDAEFFGYGPREAEILDPQHRLLLTTAWEALESAGVDPATFPGSIGAFAGVANSDYYWAQVHPNQERLHAIGLWDIKAEVANAPDYAVSRLAHRLGLLGPTVTVQTACSTSLVAVHLACQALLAGECDLALAGGASVSVPQKVGSLYREGSMFSPDGHCRAFDADARGTVFGDGVGVVALRRLEDALADGDPIRAVILGSAVNNDGSAKAGFTAPSIEGQARVIVEAQANAGIDADTVSCIEAHGTATALGDPIEVAALTEAFRLSTERTGFCALGSVKTNIGHSGVAAGVAGLIKMVLALEHSQMVPSLHFRRPNPAIDFASSPFYVNTTLRDWVSRATPRRAGVSSFGMGGVNAHVVLEEAPRRPEPPHDRETWHLLPLSARTPTALEAATARLARHLARTADEDVAAVAATLQRGRRAFAHRRFLLARRTAEAAEILARGGSTDLVTGGPAAEGRPVALLFPGQGVLRPGLGAELREREPVFRKELEGCLERLEALSGEDLSSLLAPPPGREQEAWLRLARTDLGQPLLFAVQHALARLWLAAGIEPAGLLGHSFGELVAAALAGVFSLGEALAFIVERGRLLQSLPPGAMLAVSMPESELRSLLGDDLTIAAANAPGRWSVAGPAAAVAELEELLQARRVPVKRLPVDRAFHSAAVEPILAPLERFARGLRLNPPRIPLVSSVTGTWLTREQAVDPAYWARQARATVRFLDGVRTLATAGDPLLLEVGPRVLGPFSHRILGSGAAVLSSLPLPEENRSEHRFWLESLGRSWVAGVRVDWAGWKPSPALRVPLPTYPFEERLFWLERPAAQAVPPAGAPEPARSGARLFLPSWRATLPPALPPRDEIPGRWLLFLDERGLGSRLARFLRSAGAEVATVGTGPAFTREGPGAYIARTASAEDHGRILDDLRARGTPPSVIVHLGSVTGPTAGGPEEDLDRGFFSLLALAQAVGQRPDLPKTTLLAVSDGTQAVGDGVPLRAEKAALIGPCRVLPRELPRVACGSVDLVLPSAGSPEEEWLLERLAAEAAGAAMGQTVAYRGRRRLVLGFDEAAAPPARELSLDGAWLITGGLGGVGLALARDLAQAGASGLALVARTRLPERDRWEPWLAGHGPADPVSRKLRALLEIETLGAEVLLLTADVSEERQIEEAVARARHRFGHLTGVVHAAGLPGGGVIQLRDPKAARDVLAPKLLGARNLDAALEEDPPDVFVLCSSTLALAGLAGQADYAAANAALDAFAAERAVRARGLTVSIAWDAWQGVGMAASFFRAGSPPSRRHPLLDSVLSGSSGERLFVSRLAPGSSWLAGEHRIAGVPSLPGTALVEMVRAAVAEVNGPVACEIRDLSFLAPVPVTAPTEVWLRLRPEGESDSLAFQILSRSEAGNGHPWREHARGRALPASSSPDSPSSPPGALAAGMSPLPDDAGREDDLVEWGPRWKSRREVFASDGQVLARLELPAGFASDLHDFALHPALLDVALAAGGDLLQGGSFLPLGYRRLVVRRPLPAKLWSRARLRSSPGAEVAVFDVELLDGAGALLVEVEGYSLRRVAHGSPPGTAPAAEPPPIPEMSDGISVAEACAAFRQVLALGAGPHVVVAARHPERPVPAGEAVARPAAGGARPLERRPDLPTAYAPPETAAERELAAVWESLLGIGGIGRHDNFFSLGGDSIAGIQMVEMAHAHGLRLSPDQIFAHPTLSELASVVAGESVPEEAPAIGALAAGPLSSRDLSRVLARFEGEPE